MPSNLSSSDVAWILAQIGIALTRRGHATVANLFYNLARRTVGLVGLWDVVAFDEVAGIGFQDKDGVQIMKDYMASGSFARGRDAISAYASMVVIGNIDN